MKTFIFKNFCPFGGGCAIIAAHSKEEAVNVLESYKNNFASQYTDSSMCEGVSELTPNCNEPKVIIFNFYSE